MVDLSIIIINYNSKKYIKNCLKSCINQKTKFSYEIILIDDASTDKSLEEVIKFKSKSIKIFKNKKNMGIEKTSNLGLKKAKGKYVCRVDSDDLIQPNFIETMIKSFKAKYSFLYSNYNVINSSGKIISKKKIPEFNKIEILFRGDFLATGTVYKKSILKKNNYYNTKTKNCGLENFELILNLIIKNRNLGYRVNKFLFSLRKHTKNMSKIKKKSIISYGNKIMKKMKLGYYSTNLNNPNFI
tara:strand:- start:565 stop:1290 length:726 start_codon:yes stop_codon:yes gene_type:complete